MNSILQLAVVRFIEPIKTVCFIFFSRTQNTIFFFKFDNIT